MSEVKSLIFNIAEVHARKIGKEDFHDYPICEMESGVWFGSVFAMIKVEPFRDCNGMELDYSNIESQFPFLKEETKGVNMDEWFELNAPDKIEGNKIEFTDIIIPISDNIENNTFRIYKINNQLGVVSPEFDYLCYGLSKSFIFVAKEPGSPIIGLKPGKGNIKDRAVIILMPLRVKQKEIKNAICRTKKGIKELEAKGDGDNF
jgi:hypothetical protein